MAFITTNDYTALIRDEIKGILLENYSDTKLHAAEQMAMSQVKNYLSGIYDTEALFTAEGDTRNSHIVMVVIDCALYHLYTSTTPNKIPAVRAERYGDAMAWLKDMSRGDARADLPHPKTENGSADAFINVKSKHQPQNNKW